MRIATRRSLGKARSGHRSEVHAYSFLSFSCFNLKLHAITSLLICQHNKRAEERRHSSIAATSTVSQSPAGHPPVTSTVTRREKGNATCQPRLDTTAVRVLSTLSAHLCRLQNWRGDAATGRAYIFSRRSQTRRGHAPNKVASPSAEAATDSGVLRPRLSRLLAIIRSRVSGSAVNKSRAKPSWTRPSELHRSLTAAPVGRQALCGQWSP